MARIARRIGLVDGKAGYEEIQKKLVEFIPWGAIPKDKEERVIGLFWLFAKHTCNARKPRCSECMLNKICEKII